jgi:hypothetical protein
MLVSFRQFWNAVELSHQTIINPSSFGRGSLFLSGCDGRASTFALTWVVSILIEAMGDKRNLNSKCPCSKAALLAGRDTG